jgi:hypothetical protein
MEKLELRMYGLVNYQLTGIQQGIQFLHAVVEYGQGVKWSLGTIKLDQYNEWADQHKTVILLNGGTTNTNGERLGTMNQHHQLLNEKGIYHSHFNEPDLGDQLTAIAFIVDERVFNKEKYPDFDFTNKTQITPGYGVWSEDVLNPQFLNENEKMRWDSWVQSIGGETNLWLRFWLKNFRLA